MGAISLVFFARCRPLMPRTEKPSRLTLVSLALNAGLLAFVLFSNKPAPANGLAAAIPARPAPAPEAPAAPVEAAARPTPAMDWKESLQQSRAPRHILIAAVQADFDAKWNQRDADLRQRYTNGEIEIEDLALLNLDREIAFEATVRDALGENAFREWDRARKFADINTAALVLSSKEADKLHDIRTALTERLRALERSKLKKEIDPTTYEDRYELAQADYEQELKKLVGFQRFNEARDSGIPAYLRRELRGLGLSDAQFAQIQEIEGTYGDGTADLQYSAQAGAIDAIKLDQEQETLTQLRDSQLQQILRPQAYALYCKQQDPRYQTMTDFADRWQLSGQDVENVFQLLQAHETEIRRLKLAAYTAGLPAEETRMQVSGLQAQLDESLRKTLRTDQLEKLKRNGVIRP